MGSDNDRDFNFIPCTGVECDGLCCVFLWIRTHTREGEGICAIHAAIVVCVWSAGELQIQIISIGDKVLNIRNIRIIHCEGKFKWLINNGIGYDNLAYTRSDVRFLINGGHVKIREHRRTCFKANVFYAIWYIAGVWFVPIVFVGKVECLFANPIAAVLAEVYDKLVIERTSLCVCVEF